VEPGGAILRTPRYAMARWKEITSSCSMIRWLYKYRLV
jgi:hypothetical protein